MATTFLEPGGDADFLVGTTNGFWSTVSGAAVATDFVHGNHVKSIKFRPSNDDFIRSPAGVILNAASRISFYVYFNVLPNATVTFFNTATPSNSSTVSVRCTSAGVLQLWNGNINQIGTNGPTLSAGVWFRISLAYNITSGSVNRFELFKDGVSAISITNATLSNITSNKLIFGNGAANPTFDFRLSDIYADNSTSLTDPGNIWVTAKRPISNGVVNGFSTQIGSGGSGYGTGHSPQVNERPINTLDGWSMIGAGLPVTEEYNIEAQSVGDINISAALIVDWLGWVSVSSLAGETINVILNGVTVPQVITSTITLYTNIKGSTNYPSGLGSDIGIITNNSLTTVSLYECGILVAFIPQNPSFQSNVAPYAMISAINYSQSALGGNNLPVAGGELSNLVYFRIYNNFNLAKSVATLYNISLTVFDGIGANSHTATQSPVSQSWVRIYETGFGENSLPPGLYTQFLGQDTAIGRSGVDNYIPEFSSDGTEVSGSSYIRAGVNGNGVGFIEFATYVEMPDQVGFADYNFAISVIYDY